MRTFLSRIRHLSRRRRNRVLAALALVNLILIFLVYSNLFTYPNTYMGTTDVSGKTAGQITTLIESQKEKLPMIQVKDRTYHYKYDQLGVVIDPKTGVHELFAPNRKLFPLNLFAFFESLFSRRTVKPPLAFTQQYEQFVTDNTFDFSATPDDVSIDPTIKAVVIEENSEVYRFDSANLRELLVTRFGDYRHPIYPMLAKVTNETVNQIADANQRLANIFSSPIIVYLDLGGMTQAVELKEEDIREATAVTLSEHKTYVKASVNADALNRVITRRIHQSGFPIRNDVVTQNVRDDFAKAISLRFNGSAVNAVATALDAGPNTNGTLAKKYIEVDISQAKMYLFRDGNVYKSFKVSTGLDYPTPVGQFTILNKVGLGFSNIYKDWLPWWMGFAYSEKLGAYFGIHEQPYTLASDGTQIQSNAAQYGIPSTGGCVALAPGAAREVYAFADVGTPVYIYN